MPIESTFILKYQGAPDTVTSEEEYKEWHENTFVKKDSLLDEIKKSNAKTGFVKDVVDTATGKRMGALAGKLKTNLVKLGVEISEEDSKKKPIEELMEFAIETHLNATSGTINELQEKLKKNSGEQNLELAEKLRKTEETNLALKAENKKLGLENTEIKTKSAEEIKGIRVLTIREQAMGKIPRRSDIEQKQYGLMLTGFENTIDNKFKIDLDENNQPFIADKKTGERFRDPAKAGEFLGIEEVLKKEALELGISPKNPFQPPVRQVQQSNNQQQQNQQHQNNGASERPMASRKTAA